MSTRFEKLYEEEVKKSTRLNLKPSTELIPDEYQVNLNGEECVHVFVTDEDMVEQCEKLLQSLQIKLSAENIHIMETYQDTLEALQQVASTPNETSLMLLLFWGYSEEDGEFILEDEKTLPFFKIWSMFLTSQCSNFRDKPKVFVFNVIKSSSRNQFDGMQLIEPISPYEVPNEADVLIVYKHNQNKRESEIFIEELSETLKTYGQIEDISTLVSIIDTAPYTRPIIISTMLKRLFMIPSTLRGHYLNLEQKHQLALSELIEVDKVLTEKENEIKESLPSLLRKMTRKFTSSFRSKNSSGNGSSKRDNIEIIVEKVSESSTTTSIATTSAPGTSTKSTVPRPIPRDVSKRPSVERNAPRTSVDQSVRRPSVSRSPAKKFSREERKPWIP